MTVKGEIIDNLLGQVIDWDKLTPLACEATEKLVDEGVQPDKCGGKDAFFGLVYQQILQSWVSRSRPIRISSMYKSSNS
jgi:hypothetical protein